MRDDAVGLGRRARADPRVAADACPGAGDPPARSRALVRASLWREGAHRSSLDDEGPRRFRLRAPGLLDGARLPGGGAVIERKPFESPAFGGLPQRKPPWLKVRLPSGEGYAATLRVARGRKLHTVCEEARCPNIGECWGRKTATFMILGDVCTRSCGFCAVKSGRPSGLDLDEPRRTAEAVRDLGIRHAVITSVNRDELPDGGAGIFAETVRRIRELSPGTRVEILVPDFLGKREALAKVWGARPDIFGHNVECVARLQRAVRSAANYTRSLTVLEETKKVGGMLVKTGLQVGHGEAWEEILALMDDVARIGVDIFTIGQYLQPTREHLPVRRWYTPEEFAALRQEALKRGIPHCMSGALVRSSYRAEQPFE
ncbi:MAG: lipoyl synthase [Planctomycetes bacterium]|nr:lipoyl synthase [Planctomycetota bacterium]